MVGMLLFMYMRVYRIHPIAFVRSQGPPFVISMVSSVLFSMILGNQNERIDQDIGFRLASPVSVKSSMTRHVRIQGDPEEV